MANRKKEVYKVKPMTEGKRNIIQGLLQEYDIETAQDIQAALKDLLGSTLKEMMEAEMDDHLGYSRSQRSDSDDYRNGYKTKQINSPVSRLTGFESFFDMVVSPATGKSLGRPIPAHLPESGF